MMNMLDFLSVCMIPILFFCIIGSGVINQRPVFEDFTEGAASGLKIIVEIAPTIIGLMVAVGVLRTSGTLDLIGQWLQPIAVFFSVPVELLPLSIVKMFSASGANGLLFDIFKEYGTDSVIGFSASVLLSCTETLFYTVSVYYMSVGIGKTRWTIPAGIVIAICSLFLSIWVTGNVIR